MGAAAGRTLDNVGQRVLQVAISGGIEIYFGLRLAGELPYILRIEAPFLFRDGAGEVSVGFRATDDEGLATLGRVGSILGSYCTEAVMEPDESLRLRFSD